MAEEQEEQTREERLEIARRYRERRGQELKALASQAVEGEIVAAGEFSAVPKEAMAAVPFVGMLMIPLASLRARRSGLPKEMLIALDHDDVHVLAVETGEAGGETSVEAFRRWPRGAVRVDSVRRAFMRTIVELRVPDEEDALTLYAPSLRTNPWSSEVVRLLGGDAPEPLDLSG